MKKGGIQGIIMLAVGAFIIYWAVTHSPKAGLGQIVSNELSGSYTMGEGAYYASLVVGTVIAALGLLKTYKAMK